MWSRYRFRTVMETTMDLTGPGDLLGISETLPRICPNNPLNHHHRAHHLLAKKTHASDAP